MSTEGYLVIGCNLGCWTNYRAKGQWPSRRGHTLGHAFLANAQADGPTAATCPRRWAHHRHAANGPTVTEVWERATWDESHEGGDHGLRDRDVGRRPSSVGQKSGNTRNLVVGLPPLVAVQGNAWGGRHVQGIGNGTAGAHDIDYLSGLSSTFVTSRKPLDI